MHLPIIAKSIFDITVSHTRHVGGQLTATEPSDDPLAKYSPSSEKAKAEIPFSMASVDPSSVF